MFSLESGKKLEDRAALAWGNSIQFSDFYDYYLNILKFRHCKSGIDISSTVKSQKHFLFVWFVIGNILNSITAFRTLLYF